MKNRKKNREALYKSFFLLLAVVSAAGVQLCLPHETPLSFPQKNEPVFTAVLNNEEAADAERSLQESLRGDEGKKKVNLNSATIEDLQKLSGIGEKTALKILEYKRKNGPFRSIEEIMEVKGIGPKKFEEFKSFISTD